MTLKTMTKMGLGAIAAFTVASLATAAQATIITFGTGSSIDPLVLNQEYLAEGDFAYKVTNGNSWALDNTVGEPVRSLSTGIPNGGEIIEFYRTGGGQFTFDSFQYRPGTQNNISDGVTFSGEVQSGPVPTLTINGFSTVDPPSFTTQTTSSSGFSNTPITKLLITVISTDLNNGTALFLDNLVLTPLGDIPTTPEPSPILGLLAVSGLGLIFLRKG